MNLNRFLLYTYQKTQYFKNCLFLGAFVFLLSNLSFSQVENDSIQINPSLLEKFFDEVQNGSGYKYDSEYKRIYLEQLSRIEFIYSPYVENQHQPKLSTIERITKYNPNLNFDLTNFNPNEFNFIKYGFNFYASYDQFIRVDNNDYIIHILPKNN